MILNVIWAVYHDLPDGLCNAKRNEEIQSKHGQRWSPPTL